jgi:hypothetical protein
VSSRSGKPAALGTSLHLWAAVGDSLAVWLQPANKEDSPTVDCSLPPPPTALAGEDQDEFIAWSLPDLARNGPWHRARQVSLKAAVVGLPNASQLITEGERALDIHRENYTAAGPKRLQLLWWEFPPEHWDALRLGSSMNFLVWPSGELELNSEMDEVQLEVAARFVDELISLGVLVEATEELRATGPLFLVPKPGQPGEWRCISDMKRGGHPTRFQRLSHLSATYRRGPTRADSLGSLWQWSLDDYKL